MVNYQDMIKLLGEKHELFRQYEAVTEQMLTCPIDDLESCVKKRDRLIAGIDRVDAAVGTLVSDAKSPLLYEAVRGKCDRGDLDDAVGAVYDAAAAVRSVISRLPDVELQVDGRLMREQQCLLELIKSTNRGMEAQASRFATGQDAGGTSLDITRA